jgi:hypothetical protein
MPMRQQQSLPLVALVAAVAVLACESAGPTAPDDLAPGFHHQPGHGKGGGNGGGGGDDGGDGGGSDGPVVTLSGAASGDHGDKTIKENNRQVEIGGGPQSETSFAFAGARGRYEAGQCTAARGNPDGPTLDAGTAAELAGWLTAEDVLAGVSMTYDKRSDGQASDGHDLSFNFTDAAGRGVSVAIFAHGSPPPTIHRDGDTFRVSGGVVRVWLRDGPPRNHPKLFCGDHGDVVTLTVER